MSSIDQRVVQMKMDDSQFQKGVKSTLTGLNLLKKGLELKNGTKGMDDISKAAQNVDFSAIEKGILALNDRFSTLGIVGMRVIQNLTDSALRLGSQLFSSVVSPLTQGGSRRAANLEHANFMFEGLGMDAKAIMEDANYAVKGTAFGLDEAAKAAAQFGAAGTKAGEDMKVSLRSISGVAAMTSSSYSDISDIFVGISGNGRVMGNDLLSLSSRGINAAAIMAQQWGKTEAEVRQMVTKGQVSFKMFAKAMDDAFGEQSKKANETYTGSLSNMNAAWARIGATVYSVKLEKMRDVFNSITPAVDALHEKLKPLLSFINEMQGLGSDKLVKVFNSLTDILKGDRLDPVIPNIVASLRNSFEALGKILLPIKIAFQDIFRGSMVDNIVTISESIKNFTANLVISDSTMGKLYRVFKGIFSLFSIGWEVVKVFGEVLSSVFKLLFPMTGGFLDLAAAIGDYISNIEKVVKEGGGLQKVSKGILDVLSPLAGALRWVSQQIASLAGWVRDRINEMRDALGGFESVGDGVGKIFGKIKDAVVGTFEGIKSVLGTFTFDQWLSGVNIGIFAAIGLGIKKFVDNLGGLLDLNNPLDSISDMLGAVRESLEKWQSKLKSDVLLKLAISIGILSVSLLLLASIDPDRLLGALGAVGALFTELGLAMFGFVKIMDGRTMAGLITAASAMTIFTVGILALAGAVRLLGSMSMVELGKGLVSVSILIGGMVAASKTLETNSKGMISASISMIALAVAIRVMAGAVKALGSIENDILVKGLSTFAGVLAMLVIYSHTISEKKLLGTANSMVILGLAMKIIASVLKDFGNMSWEAIVKGLLGLAGSLGMVTLAMNLMPQKGMISASVGLIAVGVALKIIASALNDFGGMDPEKVGQSLFVLAGSLLVIAVVLRAMTGAMGGAASLLIVASALAVLAPVLKMFSELDAVGIAKSLGMLAGVLIIFGVAAAVMAPMAPVLLLVAGGIALMGAAALAAGVGMLALATGLTMLAAGGSSIALALGLFIITIANLIPLVAQKLAEGLYSFIATLARYSPLIVAAIGKMLLELVGLFVTITPRLTEAILNFVLVMLNLLVSKTPEFVAAGFALLLAILTGIRDNIQEVVTVTLEIISEFIRGVAAGIGGVIEAGTELLVEFLNGVRDAIPEVIPAAVEVVTTFCDELGKQTEPLADAALKLIKDFVAGLWSAIRNQASELGQAGENVVFKIRDGIFAGFTKVKDTIVRWAQNLGRSIIGGIDSGTESRSPSRAAIRSAKNVVDGLVSGMKQYSRYSERAGHDLGSKSMDALRDSISDYTKMIDVDLDLTPVIRPVLDLSSIENGANDVDSIFGKNPGITLHSARASVKAASIGMEPKDISSKETPELRGVVLNYTQNNNSPKALSREDIYRQTRNQLSVTKEALSRR